MENGGDSHWLRIFSQAIHGACFDAVLFVINLFIQLSRCQRRFLHHHHIIATEDTTQPTPLRQLRSQKEEAFRSGDRSRFKEAKYRFSKEVRGAKRLYSEKLQHQFSAKDSASVWKGLRELTHYKPRAPHSANDLRLSNNLNKFYCRFERQWDSPDTIPWDSIHQPQATSFTSPTTAGAWASPQLQTSEAPFPSTVTPLSILERDVNRQYKRQNLHKAAGPDSVSPSTLKHCADQLSLVFTDIFNTSLEISHIPACFKCSSKRYCKT